MKKINKNCDCACVVTDSKNNSEVRFFPYRSSGKVVGGMIPGNMNFKYFHTFHFHPLNLSRWES